MATQKKIDTVTELTEKIGKATSIVLTEYQGLKHKQLEELRKMLRKVDAEFVVIKNRLLKRALGDTATSIESLLEQPSAALFSYADEVAPLKELLKFFKTTGFGKTKGGLLGTTVMTDEDVTRLSKLAPRQQLLGQLASQMNAPIQGLHYALSWNLNKFVWALEAIKNSKSKVQS